jgi:hypothetical protein
MIQILLPGGNNYVLMAVSVACLTTLLTWMVRLCTSIEARLRTRAHPRIAATLLLLLAIPGAAYPISRLLDWRETREALADRNAHSMTLASSTLIDGIALPAGAKLLVIRPGDADTYQSAELPPHTSIFGLDAQRINRYKHRVGDLLPAGSVTISLALTTDQTIDGWLCTHRHGVEFALPKGGLPQFRSCNLGADNLLEKNPVPEGGWIASRAAGADGAAGWLLRTEGRDAITLSGLPLLKAEAKIDSSRRVIAFEGQLASETKLGTVIYPSGTGVRLASPGIAGAVAGDLIFSPARGRGALRMGGVKVPPDNSVLQAPDGTVRSVKSNRSLGVTDVADHQFAP